MHLHGPGHLLGALKVMEGLLYPGYRMRLVRLLGVLVLAAVAPLAAQAKPAAECLAALDQRSCLVDAALAALAQETQPETRADSFQELLSAVTQAGLKRDDVYKESFFAHWDDAPAVSRWSLEITRMAYALKFSHRALKATEIKALEQEARKVANRSDGRARMRIISTACDMRQATQDLTQKTWQRALDRLCTLKAADVAAIEKLSPGMAAVFAAYVDSQHDDEETFSTSLAASVKTLARYEAVLYETSDESERNDIHAILALGHVMNASALVFAGDEEAATAGAHIALNHLKAITNAKAMPDKASLTAEVASVLAMADEREEALELLADAITQAESASPAEKASTYATCIEALSSLGTDI